MTAKLEALFRRLDSLAGRASLQELTRLLEQSGLTADDLGEFIRFSDSGYQRNLVRSETWYHVWVMCWKNGQRSPIHDHAASSCAVKVLRGTLTETHFDFAANGLVYATGSRTLSAGDICATQDHDLHQISNLQAGEADLVTLHVYSPPLVRMGTYSLTERDRGEDVWIEERKVVTAFPENSETPLESVHGWVTPNRLFFVRDHFEMPVLDRSSWRLRVEGCVRRPAEWTWDQLTALPEKSLFATVECAGNGRSFLRKRAPGVQWGAGAIGHAEWTGVPLARVLEQSGLRPEAVEVVCIGADRGTEPDHPEPMHFARGLPLAKALHPDTLLVYRMNGELLSPSHGFPVRLFVPGWYGVASVKWVTRIEVLDRPFAGYYQSRKYTVQRQTGRGLETVVVGPMAVKSEIVRPRPGAVLGPGMNRLFGLAWAGEEPVAAVEISTDAGRTWSHAQLIGPAAPYSWTLWEYLWEVGQPGDYTLLARAVSAGGQVQPMDYDPLNHGYLINFCRPCPVQVQSAYLPQTGDWQSLLFDMNAFAEANAGCQLDVHLEFAEGEGI